MPGAGLGRLAQLFEDGTRVVAGLAAGHRDVRGRVRALATADGGGPADAARVEGDHVVAVRQAHEVLARIGELADARAARAAEVEQHRTPGRARGPVAGHRQFEGVAPGLRVVERDGDLAALEAVRRRLVQSPGGAGRPVDLLVVEAGQAGLVVRRGHRRRARPQQGECRGRGERPASVRGPHDASRGGVPAVGRGGALEHDMRVTRGSPPGGRAWATVTLGGRAPAESHGPESWTDGAVSPMERNGAHP